MTQADVQADLNVAATEYAQTMRQVYTTVLDAAMATQERNVKFTQSIVERGLEELKSQTDTAREVVHSVTQQTEKQRATFETLARQSMDAYMDYLHNAASFYARGLEAMRRVTE